VDERTGAIVAFIGQRADIAPMLRAARRQSGRQMVFVAASTLLKEEVEAMGQVCRSLGSYLALDRDEEIKKTATDWLDAWSDQREWDGRTYKEAVEIEGVGAWWFILPILIPDVLRCVQYAEELLALIKAEQPQSLWLLGIEKRKAYPMRLGLDLDLPGKMAAFVCRRQDIEVREIDAPVGHRLAGWKRYVKARWGMAFYFTFVQSWVNRWRVWLTRGAVEGLESDGRGAVALVTSPVYWRQGVDLNGDEIVDDAIAGTCMKTLALAGYRLLGIDVDLSAPNRRQFDILREKKAQQGVQWRAIEHYYRVDKKKSRLRRTRLKNMARTLGGEVVCQQGMRYSGIDIAPLLSARFDYLFEHYLAGAMGYLDALERAFAQEKIQAVLIVYEEGPAGRAATIAGQRLGVPTLALQHGTLSSPYAPAYYLPAVTTSALGDPAVCPVPTITAVYGQHTRTMLVETSTYPAESVVVVGMPAYDGVVRSLRQTAVADARRALAITDRRPMVLIISQPFFTRENRDYFASAVVEAAGNMPEIQWVIKLHPSEGGQAWAGYLRGRMDNIRVFGADLHLLLNACELVVSWYSTVILEAALFAKPVISVQIPGCLAPIDYLRDGLVVGAENAGDIENRISAFLQDDAMRQGHLEQVSRALGQYIYQADGAASARVMDLLETLVRRGGSSAAVIPQGE